MTTVKMFEDLAAWQHARVLTQSVYTVTRHRPFETDLGLRNQIRRASVSVMANIAEGFESRTNGLFLEYLGRAKASAGEVRAHLYVALDAGYLTERSFHELAASVLETSRCIHGLMKYLAERKSMRS